VDIPSKLNEQYPLSGMKEPRGQFRKYISGDWRAGIYYRNRQMGWDCDTLNKRHCLPDKHCFNALAINAFGHRKRLLSP
jgi:hypothetical protein